MESILLYQVRVGQRVHVTGTDAWSWIGEWNQFSLIALQRGLQATVAISEPLEAVAREDLPGVRHRVFFDLCPHVTMQGISFCHDEVMQGKFGISLRPDAMCSWCSLRTWASLRAVVRCKLRLTDRNIEHRLGSFLSYRLMHSLEVMEGKGDEVDL